MWLSSWLPTLTSASPRTAGPRRPARTRRPARRQLVLEPLQDRCLLAILTVNSSADTDLRNSALTLREAILVANGTLDPAAMTAAEQSQVSGAPTSPAPDTIAFAIPATDPGRDPASSVFTLRPTSALPTLTDPVLIDGYTQPGAAVATVAPATLRIALDGSDAGIANGLHLAAGGSSVRGLAIHSFQGNGTATGFGILLAESGGHAVTGNHLGTDAAGTTARANASGVGIHSPGNRVGGTAAADRNVLSDNRFDGVYVDGRFDGATGNRVEGNYIGTDATGTIRPGLGNASVGVRSILADGTVVGGVAAGASNRIAGNIFGVSLNGSDHVIQGNTLRNASVNVLIQGGSLAATDILVGGRAPGAGNVLVFSHIGVQITGPLATGNRVEGNYIGTDAAGSAGLGNDLGVLIDVGANGNTVGGAAAGARNVISGNVLDGVRITGSGTTGNAVQGNYIGTNRTGTGPLANATSVRIANGAHDNRIGGTSAAARNVISGNRGAGVAITGVGAGDLDDTTGNRVQGNYIGTDRSGNRDLGNSGAGVLIDQASGNTVGRIDRSASGAGNVITFNQGAGVRVQGTNASGNSIVGNSVHENGLLGIDLVLGPATEGVTPYDIRDLDAGPHGFQNFPVLILAERAGARTRVAGILNSTPNTTFLVDFYASPSVDPTGFGEGERYLGALEVRTDHFGDALFDVLLDERLGAGEVVTATATGPGGTSGFSAGPLGDATPCMLAGEGQIPETNPFWGPGLSTFAGRLSLVDDRDASAVVPGSWWRHVTGRGDILEGIVEEVLCGHDGGDGPSGPGVRSNIVDFLGTATWNGEPGYSFVATIHDRGGARPDFYRITVLSDVGATVYFTAGAPVSGDLRILAG